MSRAFSRFLFASCVGCLLALVAPPSWGVPTWKGVVRDAAGNSVSGALVELRAISGGARYAIKTSPRGEFALTGIVAGSYELDVISAGKTWKSATLLLIKDDSGFTSAIELSHQNLEIRITSSTEAAPAAQTGGENLSKEKVSSLPLNERDFSKLLLLAAGTMTDANGAANFTQQFAVNGQRGVTSVFAIDGGDTTDPELGGATFANFNVDAIQEV